MDFENTVWVKRIQFCGIRSLLKNGIFIVNQKHGGDTSQGNKPLRKKDKGIEE